MRNNKKLKAAIRREAEILLMFSFSSQKELEKQVRFVLKHAEKFEKFFDSNFELYPYMREKFNDTVYQIITY